MAIHLDLNDSTRKLLRYGLGGIIALVVAFGIWQVLVRPFVKVVLPAGADSVQLDKAAADGSIVSAKANKITTLRLSTGEYNAVFYKDGKTVGMTKLKVKPGLRQTLTATLTAPAKKLNIFMHQHADMVTPLAGGYLYVDTITRAVGFADTSGMHNISEQFQLQQIDPQDSSFTSYDTVINIQSLKDGSALVTTTSGVFIAKSPGNVTQLPVSSKEFLAITSSSYDAATNRLFFLSAANPQVFYYDLGRPQDEPKTSYKAPHEVNRLTAGGGKVAVYFDSIPSLEPDVLKAYAVSRQLAPIIFEGSDGKVIKKLNDWQGTTQLTISDDGTFIAIKKKFASEMSVQSLTGRQSYTVAAPDMNALGWKGDTLYFGRNQGIWSVKPAQTKDKITYVSASKNFVTKLFITPDKILAATTNNLVSELVAQDAASSRGVTDIQEAVLQTKDYFIAFVDIGSAMSIAIETRGNFDLGLDDTALANSMAIQYQSGLSALRGHINPSAASVKQAPLSIDTPFEANIPKDED